MTHAQSMFCFGFAILLLAGCDQDVVPMPFERRESKPSSQELEEARERESEQKRLIAERQIFRLRLSSTLAVISNDLETAERGIAKVASDQAALSARISALSQSDGLAGKNARSRMVLNILGDEVINNLARRYLGRDFRLARLKLAEAVAKATEDERLWSEELKANKDAYDEEVGVAKNESQRARAEARRAEENMRKAIDSLVTRRNILDRKLQLVSAKERTRLGKEMGDIDAQLRSLKTSYDGMRASRAVTSESASAGRTEDRAKDTAVRRRAAKDELARKRFKGMKKASEIVSDYEQSTICVLENALVERQEKLEQSKREKTNVNTAFTAMAANVDNLGIDALKKANTEIDKVMKQLSSAD